MKFKNKIISISFIICVFICIQGCNKNWDDHYNTLNKTTEKDKILAEMEKIPEISKFTERVKQIDTLSDLLEQNRLYTVFAPINETFENMDPEILNNEVLFTRMLMYHFIEGKYKYKDISSGDILTFNNKYLNISLEGSTNNLLFDTSATIIEHDFFTLNGMIQVIDLPLIPLNNLYEYFTYNTYVNKFAKAIHSYTIKEFNIDASTPIGINSNDELIYDSVFNITNPFLYSINDFFGDYMYNVYFRYINITNEALNFTFVVPTNFESVINAAQMDPFLNNTISDHDLAGPILTSLIWESLYTKEKLISDIYKYHSSSQADTSKIQLYIADLLENNYEREISLSNGIVHEVNSFEYDLCWLIQDQVNIKNDQDVKDYQEDLLLNVTYSDNVDTIYITSKNMKTVFYYSETDFYGYSSKYGEWVDFKLDGDFYPVDYKVLIKGRNQASGTFKVEIEGQEIAQYDFSTAPSGDDDSDFDEIGTVSFNETKSTTNLKFTFINTHPETNTGEQYLWIREIKLSPILE